GNAAGRRPRVGAQEYGDRRRTARRARHTLRTHRRRTIGSVGSRGELAGRWRPRDRRHHRLGDQEALRYLRPPPAHRRRHAALVPVQRSGVRSARGAARGRRRRRDRAAVAGRDVEQVGRPRHRRGRFRPTRTDDGSHRWLRSAISPPSPTPSARTPKRSTYPPVPPSVTCAPRWPAPTAPTWTRCSTSAPTSSTTSSPATPPWP